jgi:hypothetical protein
MPEIFNFSDYPLLRFKHSLLGDPNLVQDTQVLSMSYGKLSKDSESEMWLLKVFHMHGNREVDVPVTEIIPELF